MRYLVKQLKGTRPVAELLGITQRTVERYVKDQIKSPGRTWRSAWNAR
jgi:predicted transcriptional regulator